MKIEINFFPVEFASTKLPFWTRKLQHDEKLRPSEKIFGLRGKTPTAESARAVQYDGKQPSPEHAREEHEIATVKSFVISVILEGSLRVKMKELGYVVDRSKTSVCFFDPKRKLQGVPDFLTVLRGLEFRADTLHHGDEEGAGFFISTTSRVMFTRSLEDSTIAKVALNRPVM